MTSPEKSLKTYALRKPKKFPAVHRAVLHAQRRREARNSLLSPLRTAVRPQRQFSEQIFVGDTDLEGNQGEASRASTPELASSSAPVVRPLYPSLETDDTTVDRLGRPSFSDTDVTIVKISQTPAKQRSVETQVVQSAHTSRLKPQIGLDSNSERPSSGSEADSDSSDIEPQQRALQPTAPPAAATSKPPPQISTDINSLADTPHPPNIAAYSLVHDDITSQRPIVVSSSANFPPPLPPPNQLATDAEAFTSPQRAILSHSELLQPRPPASSKSRLVADKQFTPQYLDLARSFPVTRNTPLERPAVRNPITMASASSHQVSINDQIIAPTAFTADAGQQSAEDFLNHFQRYCLFKNFTRAQQADLFGLLLRGAPGQWYSTLPPFVLRDVEALIDAFKKAYFPNANLLWQDTQQLLNTAQMPNESVTAFIARVKHLARRLDITQQTLHHAVIAGLRPSVRQFVVTQGGLTDLETAIEVAQRAECGSDTDPMTKILLNSVESQTKFAESQNKRLDELSERFRSLATRQDPTTTAAALQEETFRREPQREDRRDERGRSRDREYDRDQPRDYRREDRGRSRDRNDDRDRPRRYSSDYDRSRDRSREYRPQERRPPKPTPQRSQRENCVRQQSGEPPVVFQPRRTTTPTRRQPCGNCGYQHEPGACRAKNRVCSLCHKMNHFASQCRAGRNQRY